MEFLEAKATATPTTDLGQFDSLVATWDRDRGGDVIKRGAFAKSIDEWRSVGRLVPLHDNHDADAIVGEVDPFLMFEAGDGLRVSGRVDLDTLRGREIWKSLKRNRIAFSFGYMATKEQKRADGGRDLLEVDVYEVSVTASPMNNRTRVISTKSDDLSYEEFKERSLAVARAVPRQPTEQELAELRAESMALVREILPRPEQVEEA